MDNTNCFNQASQVEVYEDIEALLIDFTHNQSIKSFAIDLWELIPDLSKALANCNILEITTPISQAFENNGAEIFAKISQEYTTITALHTDMHNQLSERNFLEAGQQFGNILRLIFISEPMLSGISNIDTNLEALFKGIATGFQPKPTPLSKCYNATAALGGSTHGLNAIISQCFHFNFNACNEVPAYLTLFNANVGEIYNGCEYQVLVEKIEEVNNPTRISEIVFIYYSNQVEINTLQNQFKAAQGKQDYYTMGLTMASILRILLGFSISQ